MMEEMESARSCLPRAGISFEPWPFDLKLALRPSIFAGDNRQMKSFRGPKQVAKLFLFREIFAKHLSN